ncbi:Tautomerase/MIF superfamily [Lasiosphaeria ovina]|uniref:L-dopachrome isomerase n=1 Tax=Lasiosphaeria ovina TaxID=92902 RepID=A0AAE0KNZ2_9PEZI|nr:Tautomerase/MIF superfamily [Lasiosphaeria ovina]
MNRPFHPASGKQAGGHNQDHQLVVPAKPSFADRRAWELNPVKEDSLMRDIDRPLPGDVGPRATKRPSKPGLVKKRSNFSFFEDAFSSNGGRNPARERVRGDAIVMVEVKTNIIITDEFTFITELSYHISTRYQRPVSSIVVTLQHSTCMLFGGSFDPAYVISVFALPSQLLPTTNKRNAALIQKHMEEATGVKPERGFLRFVPTKEEDVACNGKTLAGEIEELSRTYSIPEAAAEEEDEDAGTVSRRPKARKKLSVKSLASFRPLSAIDLPTPELTPPASADEALPPVPASPPILAAMEKPASAQQKTAKRRKSFVATIFHRSTAKPGHRSALPAIPAE